MRNILKIIFISFLTVSLDGQVSASENLTVDYFKNLNYRNVGPTRGGRVTTVHGVESQKNVFYMGTTVADSGKQLILERTGEIY